MEPSKITKIVLLSILLFFTISSVFCETLAEPPANFTETDAGTADNPYQIATLANLRWLSETQEVWGGIISCNFPFFPTMENIIGSPKYFVQTADINASETINWNDGKGFSPIGALYLTNYISEYPTWKIIPFIGSYNGNNYIVSNIYINRRLYNTFNGIWELCGFGLFGAIWNSSVTNVRMENTSINIEVPETWYYELHAFHGMLVAYAYNSQILNCSATSSLNNSFGLIGMIRGSVVEYCSSFCYTNISFSQLLQEAMYSKIGNSFGRGCTHFNYNYEYFSGLLGIAHNVNLYNVYITSIADSTNINWLISIGIYDSVSVTNSYWDMDTTNTPNSNQGSINPLFSWDSTYGLTTSQMMDSSNYIGWDFENIWNIDPSVNDGYPFLRNETIAEHLSNNSDITKPLSTTLLFENYPNPFNPETTIRFSVAKDNYVSLEIYNIKGQLVCSLVDRFYKEGTHNALWNGKDNHGNIVSSGVYFYRLNVGEYSAVKKMLLMK